MSEPVGRSRAGLAPWLVVAVVVLAGVLVRLWWLGGVQAALDGDEALTGVMVRRILHGHGFVFLAGQSYNGALEQYLQAALATVAPLTAFTLRLPEVALAALATALVYAVGRRMLATPWHAVLAAALFALGPYFEITKSVRSHGAYDSGQVVGLLGLLAALALPAGSRSRLVAAGLGGCVGLGAWLSLSSGYLLLPALLWALPALLRERRRLLPPLLAGLVVGAAPLLGWALRHGAPRLGGPQPHRSVVERLGGLFGPVLREFLGVGYLHGRPVWPALATALAVAALATAYAVACWRRRRGLADLVALRTGRRRPGDLLLVAVPVVVVMYAASRYTWYVGEPRYLFSAYPLLALGLPALLPRAGRVAVVAGLTVLVAVSGTSLATLAAHRDDGDGLERADLLRAAAYLRASGETAVYADYWTGLPLQFLAKGAVTVGPERGGRTRFRDLRQTVDGAASYAYVASRVRDPMGEELPATDVLLAALQAHHVAYRVHTFGTVVVVDGPHGGLGEGARPWELGIGLRLTARVSAAASGCSNGLGGTA